MPPPYSVENPWKRLHPLTLLFAVANIARGFLVPFLLFIFMGRQTFFGGFLLILILLSLTLALVKFFSFRYRLAHGELQTRQGILHRVERNIPLVRVQDVRVEQALLHRLFGMADVHVDTAGGQGADASLSVLSQGVAEQLRQAMYSEINGSDPDSQPQEMPGEVLRQVSLKELILAGMTTNHLASALAIIALGFGLLDDILPRQDYERWVGGWARSAGRWFDQADSHTWILLASGLLGVFLVGMMVSVGGAVVLFYNFRLSRRGEDLRRSYGLLTQRSSSLPRRRIQVVMIEESLLRRLFRLATLRADTAGAPQGENKESKSGRDVLLPVVPRRTVEELLPELFPGLESDVGQWRRVSRKAVRRGTLKGGILCLLSAAALTAVERDWAGWWPIALVPMIYLLNVISYRHFGYYLGHDYFRTRRGWMRRVGHVVPIRKTQAVVLHQTPFDRHHGLATLRLDTAGQSYTGGGPRITNVPFGEAYQIARLLAHKAADNPYHW